jgi:hypothetical protein
MGPIAAVIGAVAAVGGTIASVNAQKKAARLQQEQQTLATRRSSRQAIREAQIRRAQTMSAGQALGVSGGSGVAGGVSSLGSQLGGALGFSSQMSGLSGQIGMAQTRASIFQDVASLGGGLFSAADGFDAFGKKNNVDLTAGIK